MREHPAQITRLPNHCNQNATKKKKAITIEGYSHLFLWRPRGDSTQMTYAVVIIDTTCVLVARYGASSATYLQPNVTIRHIYKIEPQST
jgi:hypothetical protein